MGSAVKRLGVLFVVVACVLPGELSAQERTERSAFGRLEYVDSVFAPYLEAANSATFSADGKFLYVSAFHANTVVVFQRDLKTGRLAHVQTIQNERDLDGVLSICLSPDGRLAAATAFRSQSAVLFERDPKDGTLRFVDAARQGEKAVEGLSFAIDGAFSPDSQFLYVCDPKAPGSSNAAARNAKGAITAFRITRNHRLRWIESNPGKDSCFDGARNLVFHPSRNLIFVASSTANALVMLDWDPKSGKTAVRQIVRDGQDGANALGGPVAPACSPDGRFVYVSSGRFQGDSAVSVLQLTNEGRLVWVEDFLTGRDIQNFLGGNHIDVSADGRNVYAAGTVSGSLACFERDPKTGRLSYIETLANDPAVGQLDEVAGVVVAPDGEHVYLTVEHTDGVSIYRRRR